MIYKQFETADASILIWLVQESEQELIDLLKNFEYYKTEFAGIKTNKRKIEFLASRVALNILTQDIVNINYTAEGKPFCNNKNVQISISHSGKWVAVITHPDKKVGIDIELPTDRFRDLYKRFLNAEEQIRHYSATDLRKVQLAWSAKEALYKIIGNEAINFDKQLDVLDFEIAMTGSFSAVHLIYNKKYTLQYLSNEEYNLVYCIDYQ